MTQWTGIPTDWRGRAILGVTEVGSRMQEAMQGAVFAVQTGVRVLGESAYRVPKWTVWMDGGGPVQGSGFALVRAAVYLAGVLVAHSDQTYAVSTGQVGAWYDFTFLADTPGGVLVGGDLLDPVFALSFGEDAQVARVSRAYSGAYVHDFSSLASLNDVTWDASSAAHWTVTAGYASPTVAETARFRTPATAGAGEAWLRFRTGASAATIGVMCGAKSDGTQTQVVVETTGSALRARKVVAGVETGLASTAYAQSANTGYWLHVTWTEAAVSADLYAGDDDPGASVVASVSSAISAPDQPSFAGGQWGVRIASSVTTLRLLGFEVDATTAGLSWTMDQRYAAFSSPLPGSLASAHRSLAGVSSLTAYATLVPVVEMPVREDEGIARYGFGDAQAGLGATADTDPPYRAACGWHGTATDANRGSFCLVRAGSDLESLVGFRVSIVRTDGQRSARVVAYCIGASTAVAEDVSVTRRLYIALGFLAETEIPVEVRALAPVVAA